jgi:hypothetical protein
MLEAVGAVPDLDVVGAGSALRERPDQNAPFVRDIVLDRPAFAGQPVQRGADGHVVSRQAEVVCAGGEGIGDVVPIEQEDDRAEREHPEDAGAPLDPVREHRQDHEHVDRQERERKRDRIEGSATRRGRRNAHDTSIGRRAPLLYRRDEVV